MKNRDLYPAYIIQIPCNERAVIPPGSSKPDHRQRSEIADTKDSGELNQVS